MMTRYEFMQRLERGINKMPETDKAEALRYYEEYFDEAGPENEAKVVGELENPDTIATRLMAEYAYNQTQTQENISSKSYVRYIWLILLGICASPIAIPIIIAIAAVVFSILLVLFICILVFIVIAAAFVLAGAVGMGASIINIFTSVPSGIWGIGVSLALIGSGLLALVFFYLVTFRMVPGVAKGVGRLFKGISGRTRK